MNGDKQGAISLTRREALHIGLGTLLSSAVPATGARAEDGNAAENAAKQERLTISFWNFGLLSTGPNSLFHALDMRMAETVERGFNCIRTECGTGITHDAEGRPRGELEFYPVLPGHDHFTRELQHVRGGRVDLLKRLIELCMVAKRYNVKLILSSWYYLHTFWFTDKKLTAELLGLPLEKRFMVFARGLDRILETLKERELIDVVAFAEIFNEVDGFEFRGGYEATNPTTEYLTSIRLLHEEALGFLRTRHPDVLFAVDTMMPDTVLDVIPRNAQVWNFHSYYLWPVYSVFEQGLMRGKIDLNDPAAYAPVRRFLRSDAYWKVVEHTARAYREHGFWGAVARTNSGPTDPVWHEYPERLQRVNAVFHSRAMSASPGEHFRLRRTRCGCRNKHEPRSQHLVAHCHPARRSAVDRDNERSLVPTGDNPRQAGLPRTRERIRRFAGTASHRHRTTNTCRFHHSECSVQHQLMDRRTAFPGRPVGLEGPTYFSSDG